MTYYTKVTDPKAAGQTLVFGMSADGKTVAGSYLDSSNNFVGFTENVSTGTFTDVNAPTGYSSEATKISADGTTVAGGFDTIGSEVS